MGIPQNSHGPLHVNLPYCISVPTDHRFSAIVANRLGAFVPGDISQVNIIDAFLQSHILNFSRVDMGVAGSRVSLYKGKNLNRCRG